MIYRSLLIMIFLIPIIFDLFYGFLNVFLQIDFPISAIYRISLFVIVFYFFLRMRLNTLKIYIFILFILFILLCFLWVSVLNSTFLIREIQQFIRILYPYILLSFLLFYRQKLNTITVYYILRLVIYAALIASISIIFSFLTGYGLETYGDYSFATSSFFNAQNDITLSLLISISISMYLFSLKNKIYIIYAFIILFALILLGTRAGTIGGLLVILTYILIIIFLRKDISFSFLFKVSMFLFITILLIYIMYKIYYLIQDYPYMIDKYLLLLEGSPRAKLENIAINILYNRSTFESVIGQGTVLFGENIEKFYPSNINYTYGKFVEQDIFDMIGSYGILLGSLILSFPVYIFYKVINLNFKYFSIHTIFLFITMSLFIGHSFLAGHAINSPTVSSFIVIIYFITIEYNQFKKGLYYEKNI